MTAPDTRLSGQLLRFGLVGGACAVVDYTALLLWLAAGLAEDPARALSFLCGSSVAYLLNRRFTFRSKRDTREVVALSVVLALTYLIMMLVYAVAWRMLPQDPMGLTLAWALSQGVATTFNFVGQRLFVFRS